MDTTAAAIQAVGALVALILVTVIGVWMWNAMSAPGSRHDRCIDQAEHRAIYKFGWTDTTRIINYAETYCS
jgi:hypothetical protein